MRRLYTLGALLLLALRAGPAAAQEPNPSVPATADTLRALELPPELERELIHFFNDPETIRLSGPARIPAERTIAGDVAVLGGPFVIAGRIEGEVVVVNGDAELRPGAAVAGNLTVVGGQVSGTEVADVGGTVAVYPERLRLRQRGERIVAAERLEPRDSGGASDGWLARSDFLITTGQSYNRVEGLPVTFGPVIATGGSNPLLIRALAIYRTESGLTLDTDRLGYYLRAEQLLGGQRRFRVGGSLYSLVDPIEDWHLSNLENGLATFLFHDDYRDHYERIGGSVFAQAEPATLPLTLFAEARWERHGSMPAGSPWAIFGNADDWRPQPLIAAGELGSVTLRGLWDTRSDEENPAWGWYVSTEIERSFRTDLQRAAVVAAFPPSEEALPAEEFGAFTRGLVDIRRYNRVSPDSRLNFRLLAGGSLDGAPLPPQRQHALGGEGSLPGYPLFRFDCGARAAAVVRTADAGAGNDAPVYFPSYGCDGFALLQVEYRGELDLRLDWGEEPWDDDDPLDEDNGWRPGWFSSPDWSVFVDAARAWRLDGGPDEDLAVDLGLGIVFDQLGLYVAAPLNGGGAVNVFARLQARF